MTTGFLSQVGAFSPPHPPISLGPRLVTPGRDPGLPQHIALWIFLKYPIIPQRVRVLTAGSRVQASLGRWKTAGHPRSPPHFHYHAEEERLTQWEEFIRDATEVKDCLEEKAEVKIKKRKAPAESRQVPVRSHWKRQPPLPALQPGWERARTQTDFNWDQFHKYRLLRGPSIDWKPNEASVSGDRFLSGVFPLFLPQHDDFSQLLEIQC